MIILPVIGIIIISFFPMQAEFQLGVFLLLILPSAVMSNYATKLVKGNVALSITITSFCALVSFISIPIFLKIYSSFFKDVEFDLNLLIQNKLPSQIKDLLNEISGLNRMLLSGEDRYVVAYCFDCGFKNFE